MSPRSIPEPDPASAGPVRDAVEYWTDFMQRSVLFLDILRKRGNQYLETVQKGQPPVLTFNYEIIMDGRSLDRPVNHDLARIIPEQGIRIDTAKRPMVVIDPRAGHGPGIGGSKQDSEIGMALRAGHPVYFVLFYPDPEPNQTYADVKAAQIRFIEEVKRRHPEASEPAVIGNCQAGWAVALLSADRPDVTGPLILNGSPLSYWAGVEGKNPMRYRGGLYGGIWLTTLLSDLGNGKFDGANLVMNFEGLNPANTYWTKQYNVWANVDTEADRYLNFEKWWNSYFTMNADEIHFIIENLFLGNRLEKGEVELDKGRKIDLKNLEDPVIVFASSGDNITPPQQALNWIAKVYGSLDEIRRCGQVIIYRVHGKVGHLGIFVSTSVAKKEHKEFIRNIDTIEYLPPGLYEMVLEERPEPVGDEGETLSVSDYIVRFESRDIPDILSYDEGLEDEEAFGPVAVVSELNARAYRTFLRPWVQLLSNETSANLMKQLHPMRLSRYAFSDQNPFMAPIRDLAPMVKEHRRPVSDDNLFLAVERAVSANIESVLNGYRDARDATHEFLFKSIYENPWVRTLFTQPLAEQIAETEEGPSPEMAADRKKWLEAADQGGIKEGLVRVMLVMADADRIFDEREFEVAKKVIRTNKRFKRMKAADIREMVKEQARILQTHEAEALAALPVLLPTKEDRMEALEIAHRIADADLELVDAEKALIDKIRQVLKL